MIAATPVASNTCKAGTTSYKIVWLPYLQISVLPFTSNIGQQLYLEKEPANLPNDFAVRIIKDY